MSFPRGYSVLDLTIWYLDTLCGTALVPRAFIDRRTERPVDLHVEVAQIPKLLEAMMAELQVVAPAQMIMATTDGSGSLLILSDAQNESENPGPALMLMPNSPTTAHGEDAAAPAPDSEMRAKIEAASKQPETPPAAPTDYEQWITKIDESHYTLEAELLERVFAEPMAYLRRARLVPAIVDDQPAGFKLFAVRPASLIASLGFRNGDRIDAINGKTLGSPSQFLETVSELERAERIEVRVIRRGLPMTFIFEIRRAP